MHNRHSYIVHVAYCLIVLYAVFESCTYVHTPPYTHLPLWWNGTAWPGKYTHIYTCASVPLVGA